MPAPYDLRPDASFFDPAQAGLSPSRNALTVAGERAGAALARGLCRVLDSRVVRLLMGLAVLIGILLAANGHGRHAVSFFGYVALWVGLRAGAGWWVRSCKVHGSEGVHI